MSEKTESDLEKMNKDRRRAEEEYLKSQEVVLEVKRIQREGIQSPEDLLTYITAVIEDAKHSEDMGRLKNNPIVYSEAIGIRREFVKIVKLLVLADRNLMEEEEEAENAGEEEHRANNEGLEGFA